MELNNILGSLTTNTDKLGLLVGFLTGSTRGFGDVEDIIANIQNIHMPDFIGQAKDYLNQPYFKNAAMMYVAGYIIDELNPPMIGKYGGAIKKFAVGYGAGSFVQKILWGATH